MYQLSGPSQIILGDETLTVIRDTVDGVPQAKYVDGKPTVPSTQGLYTQFDLTANVQPVQGQQLLILPEGDRMKEWYWVYTSELDKPVLLNDRIVRYSTVELKDVNFQVQKVQTWGEPPNGYQQVLMVRDDVGTFKTRVGAP